MNDQQVTAIQVSHQWTPEALAEAIDREKALREPVINYYRSAMQEGHHYYRLQDGQKPALSKEGSLNLCSLFKVRLLLGEPHETYFPDGHYSVRYRIDLVSSLTGEVMATGDGLCTTRESKYAYRWVYVSDIPSDIDRAKLVYRERQNRQGGTYRQYKVPNPDLADLYNTVLKMALKRAMVDATLKLPLVSELFTQDLEEKVDEDPDRQGTEGRGSGVKTGGHLGNASTDLRNTTIGKIRKLLGWEDKEPPRESQPILKAHFGLGRWPMVEKLPMERLTKGLQSLEAALNPTKDLLDAVNDPPPSSMPEETSGYARPEQIQQLKADAGKVGSDAVKELDGILVHYRDEEGQGPVPMQVYQGCRASIDKRLADGNQP